MKILYCIEHQNTVRADGIDDVVWHPYPSFCEHSLANWEFSFCYFDMGWAYCEMPETREDWDEDVEPSQEEIDEVEEECILS